jgi:HEAT repeat protein
MRCRGIVVLLAALASGDTWAQETFQGRTLDAWSAALTSSQGRERAAAARGIAEVAGRGKGELQDAERYSQLVQLINDSDSTVRYWGVVGLNWYSEKLPAGDGGRQAVISTLEPLLEDNMPTPRIAAAQTLAGLGSTKGSLRVLVACLENPREPVRLQAANALEKIGAAAEPAVTALRKAATDESMLVQKVARRTLAKLEKEMP